MSSTHPKMIVSDERDSLCSGSSRAVYDSYQPSNISSSPIHLQQQSQQFQSQESCASRLSPSPQPPSAALPSHRRPLEGGFECEFIDKPKELQTDCPICLQILREPYQATCCGYIYCRTCIQRVIANCKPCPTCNNMNFESFPDKRLQRSLYSFQVWCSNKYSGCNWSGELGQLDTHINSNPEESKRLFGCDFTMINCSLCLKSFPRQEIENHELKKCGQRPYSCQYCSAYESTCDDVIENHWPVCVKRPVPCPNECGVYPELGDIQYHLDKECEVQRAMEDANKIECEYSFAGCKEKLELDQIKDHLKDCMETHLSLFVANSRETFELVKKLQDSLVDSQKTVEESKARIDTLESQTRELQHKLQGESQAIEELRNEIERLKTRQHEDQVSIEMLQYHSAIVPITYTLDDFEARRVRGDMGWSPRPFYTHPQGYRMKLCVDVGGNGPGKGTHISVFLCLLKGEHDANLSWPFRGSVSIQLVNQTGDRDHHTEVVKYHSQTPEPTAGRVMEDGRSARAWGKGKFISHSELQNSGFLKDNKLRFRIADVDTGSQ